MGHLGGIIRADAQWPAVPGAPVRGLVMEPSLIIDEELSVHQGLRS
jgi:hypothetical protein